ncbi:hypothetical protein BpHYR1_047631 [Brachionus plicatilis]|uniref:Uncharacterized protein n=1 Tax=Brachionus plicatilis TaxID=10195 RepID=A0A3M7PGZ6_BRAPC|nr:hypothetical protein BpHYR1_047631 [Brachionus plicatilis]
MFRAIFIKLRNIYNSLSKQYASLIVEHTLAIVSCYLLLMTCLSFGLFQARLEADSQKLTHVKNSEVVENAHTISKLFPYQKNNYFTHKSIDLGHYVEIIVKVRDRNGSFMSQHALDKFNQIYDNITRALVIPAHDPESNSTANLTYMDNLCPRRLKICAIEGSILRMKQFQDNLLNKKVNYDRNDPTQLYTEITLDAFDGTSLNFVFGKKREEECHNRFGKEKCYIHSVNIFRTRFELLSETGDDQKNAIKFMNTFEDYMDQVSQASEYHLFDISYHTSHTLEKEIVKYSVFDFKYILGSFVSIWTIYFLFMWFDLRMFKVYFREKFLNQAAGRMLSQRKKSKIFSKWFKINLYMIKTSGFLVFATFIQFSLTILSTVGLMSLFSLPVNQLLYSIIFILMIINCHQSLMLFKNISDYKLKSVSQLKVKLDLANGSDRSLFNLDIKKKLTRTIQLILVPSFCTLSTSVGAYMTLRSILMKKFEFIFFMIKYEILNQNIKTSAENHFDGVHSALYILILQNKNVQQSMLNFVAEEFLFNLYLNFTILELKGKKNYFYLEIIISVANFFFSRGVRNENFTFIRIYLIREIFICYFIKLIKLPYTLAHSTKDFFFF